MTSNYFVVMIVLKFEGSMVACSPKVYGWLSLSLPSRHVTIIIYAQVKAHFFPSQIKYKPVLCNQVIVIRLSLVRYV